MVQAGRVTVNNVSERVSYIMQSGDIVTVIEALVRPVSDQVLQLNVVYEDSDLVVVDKPAGLAVHPANTSQPAATVADFARPRTTDPDTERPGIVHRLDRDTSGLLIIAKSLSAKAYMQAAFKNRQVHKTYQLLVVGSLKEDTAVIKLPLGRNPASPLQQSIVPGGREAVTPYMTIRAFSGYTFVEARPLTGRTHQLRVHFAALGHPVAGDIVYGPPRRPLGLKRQFLHACQLEFTAPSGQLVQLESPLPLELAAVITQLTAKDDAA
jgi:23S rRNA pseudouridine1911/1915/1917 synthase